MNISTMHLCLLLCVLSSASGFFFQRFVAKNEVMKSGLHPNNPKCCQMKGPSVQLFNWGRWTAVPKTCYIYVWSQYMKVWVAKSYMCGNEMEWSCKIDPENEDLCSNIAKREDTPEITSFTTPSTLLSHLQSRSTSETNIITF